MGYPAYTEYGNGEADWLGILPKQWTFRRLRFIASEPLMYGANEAAVLDDRDLPRYIRITDVKADGTLDDDTFRSLEEAVAAPYILKEGDLLLARSGATVGKSFQYLSSWGRAAYAGYLIRFRPDGDIITPRFAAYYFQTECYWACIHSTLIQATIENFSAEKYKDLKLPLPSKTEQEQIAAFLDWKTGQIDALIAQKQELLEKLKEKRIAVITQAVTRGLNPSAPMRDSGIPWLGQVPQHWEVKRLSRVTDSRCDGPFGSGLKSEHYSDEGVRVVRLQNIGFAEFDDEDKAYIDPEYYKELGDHDVRPGDLLVAGLGDTNNPVGRACRAPENLDPAMVKADCFRYRLEPDKADSQFTAYQMSVTAMALSGALASGVTRPRMNLSLTSARILAFPPIDEQILIASYLDAESRRFAEMVARVDEAIIRLTEYRAALITAATTGKIDVRGMKVPHSLS